MKSWQTNADMKVRLSFIESRTLFYRVSRSSAGPNGWMYDQWV